KQFLKDNFVDVLVDILNETGVDPNTLAIEITESVIMEHIDVAVIAMSKLRQIGVHIHIDDFGTGYSSLSYLNKFPVTALKIDRSFIRGMSENEENREIVRTIISLGQSLNLNVIAEGVELHSQLSEIGTMECQFAQGYYFSRPLAAPDLDVWMQSKEMVSIRV
ncbi:MAG TPA: EAL domain-containing protein, partial [Saprospiraceae bacterium]|nr:EAL domain-containing protein [Saprospiraceae bacterium]